MSNDINLLPQEQLSEEKLIKLKKKLEIGSIIFLVIALILFGAVFLVWNIFASQAGDLKKQVGTAERNVNDYQQTEGILRIVKLKSGAASKIINKKPIYVETLNQLKTILPEGIYFSELSLTSEGKLNLAGNARNSVDLNTFLTYLTDPAKGGKNFKDVVVGSLASSKDGIYKFSITAQVKEKI